MLSKAQRTALLSSRNSVVQCAVNTTCALMARGLVHGGSPHKGYSFLTYAGDVARCRLKVAHGKKDPPALDEHPLTPRFDSTRYNSTDNTVTIRMPLRAALDLELLT